jgi:hypothetical protein
VIRTEPVGVVHGEQLRESRACTMDSALDRPCRGLTDRSPFLVGEARRADQKQGLRLRHFIEKILSSRPVYTPMTAHIL